MRRSIHDFLVGQLLFLLAVLALGCATSQFTRRDANVSASPSPVIQVEGAQDQSDAINRPTSKPTTKLRNRFACSNELVRQCALGLYSASSIGMAKATITGWTKKW